MQQLAKTGVEAKVAVQIKSDIETEVTKLKTSLGEIATRLKSKASTN